MQYTVVGSQAEVGTHHDASEKADTFPTVRVGHHIPVTNGKECDGDKPHGTQKVTGYILLVVVPAKGKIRVSQASCCCPRERLWTNLEGEGNAGIC